MLILRVIERIANKVHQIGDDRLRALTFQQLHQIVVGKRHIFDQYLADNTDARLLQRLVDGQRIKVPHDALADLSVTVLAFRISQRGNADIAPFFVQRICRSGFLFIRAHAVQAAHQQIAVDERAHCCKQQRGRDLKAAVFLHAVGVEGDHGDV